MEKKERKEKKIVGNWWTGKIEKQSNAYEFIYSELYLKKVNKQNKTKLFGNE